MLDVAISDDIDGIDKFSNHTRQQHRTHLFSGMHEPFMPHPDQLVVFKQHFSQYSHILPTKLDDFRKQQALKTPVKLQPLEDCPVTVSLENAGTLVVGGVPALLSAVSIAKNDSNLTYINGERWPIAYGSAWHLEQDAESEAPTRYQPVSFLANQTRRAILEYVSSASIEKTGYFPWRTLDWIGWLHHPEEWMTGLKLAVAFQLLTMTDHEKRQAMLQTLARQCKSNEQYYEKLNREVGDTLLMPGKGSIIVARNDEEVADLQSMKANLQKEGRSLRLLSKEEMIQRYGFAPTGLQYAEKTHDRVLSPNFMQILTGRIQKLGGTVINGTLINIYTDDNTSGGIAEYRQSNGETTFIPFSRLIMSLGSQPVLDKNDKPLFDVVAARGVSILAHLRVPMNYQLPPAIVCGGTNHVTKLSSKPVVVKGEDGKNYHLYLLRMTAGACITPNVSTENSADYDGTIALGLVTSARKTFGKDCELEPITVYGCNRQVSKHGQTQWLNPSPGIHIQYGAGGGGLTRGPDFAVKEDSLNASPPKMGR